MKAVDQRSLWSADGTPGDCMNACIASLLELPYEAVPFFNKIQKETGHWFPSFYNCLEENGFEWHGTYSLRFQNLPGHEFEDWEELKRRCSGVEGIYMAGGPSPRGPEVRGGHAVLVDGVGKLMHDPHPSRAGLLTIENIYLIEPKKGTRP